MGLPELVKLLAKDVEGEFEVGRGYTGSGYLAYGGALFIYDRDRGRFEPARFPVEWTWISTGKRVGKARVRVPVGTLLKHILFRKRGTIVRYYLATEEGFRELEYEEERKTWRRAGEHEVVAKCNKLEDVGVEDCWLFYVRGPLSLYFSPTTDPSEAEDMARKLERVERVLHEVKERVRELTGHEPLKILFKRKLRVRTVDGRRVIDRVPHICVKLPYLGREEFKRLAERYEYDWGDSCFMIPYKEFGGRAEELEEMVKKR